jgi:ketosteroid isomerase-like protein
VQLLEPDGGLGRMPDASDVDGWITAYERAWRAPGTAALDDVFTDDVVYRRSPWAPPISGLAALRRFWDAARSGPDEGFRMTADVVAADGHTAVVRVDVDYDDGQRWRDLWVITLDDGGRCTHFEEWPFTPDQDDGHQDDGHQDEDARHRYARRPR